MKNDAAVESFSFADFEEAETGNMTVAVHGRPTNWVWTFAGPGHDKTIEQSNRLAKERLHQERQIEQQRVNGKKVKLPEEAVDDIRSRNVRMVVDRIVGWSPVKIDGEDYAFTPDNAYKLLINPKRAGLLTQAMEFLAAESSFTPRSATS
ncbi:MULTISPECIES: hypothetical protein [unclassified Shinella]|uniref:hypothetical protein n=1 Tax=unclassified Shinella TaxID=2643062 RepID=UPI0006822A2A|nr:MULTISPECIES: hypothetical protein [unclassified Shinella]